ncbi:MAG: beta-ketoacyl synthase chain length factor [Chitinophagales bacterium]
MALDVYIQGAGLISPQRTFGENNFFQEISEYNDNVLRFITPDFKQYVHPVKIRRMSTILKAGLAAAKMAATEAALEMPDAIITSSGYGCISDTSKFLIEILGNKEKQLTPTFFMQSTYNAVGGTIAMEFGCNNYNTTYVHRGFAFENALDDAMMQIENQTNKRILLGAFDETNSEQFVIAQRTGLHKRKLINNLQLFKSDGQGTFQGEGMAFFVLGAACTASSYARVRGQRTVYAPKSSEPIKAAILDLLKEHQLRTDDIDVVVNGSGGDDEKDQLLNQPVLQLFKGKDVFYKHLTGDFCTASAIGLWIGAQLIKTQKIPQALLQHPVEASNIRHVLLLNHHWGKNCSILLLSGIGV